MKNLCVKNLPEEMSEIGLQNLFQRFGRVMSIAIMRDRYFYDFSSCLAWPYLHNTFNNRGTLQ